MGLCIKNNTLCIIQFKHWNLSLAKRMFELWKDDRHLESKQKISTKTFLKKKLDVDCQLWISIAKLCDFTSWYQHTCVHINRSRQVHNTHPVRGFQIEAAFRRRWHDGRLMRFCAITSCRRCNAIWSDVHICLSTDISTVHVYKRHWFSLKSHGDKISVENFLFS